MVSKNKIRARAKELHEYFARLVVNRPKNRKERRKQERAMQRLRDRF